MDCCIPWPFCVLCPMHHCTSSPIPLYHLKSDTLYTYITLYTYSQPGQGTSSYHLMRLLTAIWTVQVSMVSFTLCLFCTVSSLMTQTTSLPFCAPSPMPGRVSSAQQMQSTSFIPVAGAWCKMKYLKDVQVPDGGTLLNHPSRSANKSVFLRVCN